MNRIDPEAMEKQAKAIMDAFLTEMQGVDTPKAFGLQREAQTREPKQEPCEETFRRSFLANALKTKDDLLIMEKRHW